MSLTTLTRPEPTTTTRPRPPVVVVAACLAALYAVVVLWTPGRLLDQALLERSQRLVGEEVGHRADALLGLVSPLSVGLAVGVLAVVGAGRGRWHAVVAVPLALLTTEVLKLGVLGGGADQDVSLLPGTGSFPSGHVTVVAAVALTAVRVAPGHWRTAVRLVTGMVTGLVGVAVVVAGWHRPGDVVAGVLVAVLAHEVVGRFGQPAALPGGRPTTTGVTTR